jgi:hypothetical protein
MKVLKPTTDTQSIKVIPRNYILTTSVELRDDQTNESITYTPTVVKDNDYLVYSDSYTLLEGHFYDFLVQNDFDRWDQNTDFFNLSDNTWDDLNFRIEKNVVDKIFCTEQEIDQAEQKEYTINKGIYKSDTSFDKEYIIYE